MSRTIILTTLLLLSTGQAPGASSGYSFEDGNGLLRLCRGDNNLDWGVCHSYLAGIHDAQGSFAHAGLLGKRLFCTPEGIEVGALKEAFTAFADAHADELDRTASSLVIDAYRVSFPCD